MEARILIIDDNNDLSQIISFILIAEGFAVKTSDNLQDSSKLIEQWNPDVLLLDVNVNGEDSRSLCSQLKSEDKYGLKIILMSGDETTLDYLDRSGADDQIAKPFDSADLLQKIQLCLEGSTKNT